MLAGWWAYYWVKKIRGCYIFIQKSTSTLTRCHGERMNEGLSCSQLLRPQKFRMCTLRENMNQTHTKVQNALQVPNQILFLDTRVICVLSLTKIDSMRTPLPSQTQTSIGTSISSVSRWWSSWKLTTEPDGVLRRIATGNAHHYVQHMKVVNAQFAYCC